MALEKMYDKYSYNFLMDMASMSRIHCKNYMSNFTLGIWNMILIECSNSIKQNIILRPNLDIQYNGVDDFDRSSLPPTFICKKIKSLTSSSGC